jgi:hypothetical protein
MEMKHTYVRNYTVHLGLTGDRQCIIPDQVADNQKNYDGKSFIAIEISVCGWLASKRNIRVRLIGDDYALYSTGTGEIIVRPISIPKTIDKTQPRQAIALKCECGYQLLNPGYGKKFVTCPSCHKHQAWCEWI